MNNYLFIAVHFAIGYVIVTNTYLIFKQMDQDIESTIYRSVFDVVFEFIYDLEKNLKTAMEEQRIETKNDIIHNSLRIIDKLKENEKNKRP
jgi:hypothetical protein